MDIIAEDLDHINQNCMIPWEEFNHASFLIAGGNGMLPSYIAFALLYRTVSEQEFDVSITVMTRNLEKSKKKYARYLDVPTLKFVECDVMEPLKYEGKYDYIIHGASPADPRRFGTDPVEVFLTNIIGTKHLLELAERSVSKGFLYLSSGEIYGQLTGETVTESFSGYIDPLQIRNCYAEGKRGGELLCAIWAKKHQIPVKIVRLTHSFGPTMDLEHDSRVFAEFTRNVVNQEDIIMKSDGKTIRPFCYLTDVVVGMLCILTKGISGEAYNLSGDEYWSVAQLADMMCTLFPERKINVIHQKRTADDNYLESNSTFVKISSEKLKNLGWSPRTSVREGFRRTVLSFEEENNETVV